ncbi:MAG: glycosyltransferase family 39 protein [Anaerolineae bacterium]|nr:glycosyltransferase family 39 protein [Anaerolineae bacterium]
MKYLTARTWPWLLLITLAAVLIRLPYWDVIPAAFDEVEQTSFAYQIANGQIRPLTGNDAYAGPFYFYIVAGLIKAGATDPMVGRLVILVAGILTVPLTWAWVQTLGRNRLPALIAALLVALNPDLILVNSHIGGTTLLLPFLTTLFLLCLTLAVTRDSTGWLLLAGIAGGLAVQSNLIGGLAIAGGLLWFLWQTRHVPRLGKRWPLWPILLGMVVLAVFSPVIIYNLTADFGSVGALETKPYIWEHHPTIATTLNNIQRFSTQLVRQTSGVLTGDEGFGALLGVPLLYLALMVAGLVHTTRRVSALPLFILMPFALVMPIISSHYGFSGIGRFTTLLIPVWAATIAFLLAAMGQHVSRMPTSTRRYGYSGVLALLGLIFVIYPVAALSRYYARSMPLKKAAGLFWNYPATPSPTTMASRSTSALSKNYPTCEASPTCLTRRSCWATCIMSFSRRKRSSAASMRTLARLSSCLAIEMPPSWEQSSLSSGYPFQRTKKRGCAAMASTGLPASNRRQSPILSST